MKHMKNVTTEPRAPQLDDELAVRGRACYDMTASRLQELWSKKPPVAAPSDPALRELYAAHREVLVARDIRYAAIAGREGIARVMSAMVEVMDRFRAEMEEYRPVLEHARGLKVSKTRIEDAPSMTDAELDAIAERDAVYVQAAAISSALSRVVALHEDLQDEAEAMAIAETIAEAKHADALDRLQRAGHVAA